MAIVRPDWITVVSGVPRAGPSLMMSMLTGGGLEAVKDDVRSADEDNPKGYFELEAVKRLKEDASWVGGAVGKVVKAVHVHVRNLPRGAHRYRVVLMRRDMGEVMRSQRKMLERRGRPGGALSDERAAALFLKQLADLEAWMAAEPGFSYVAANYNELLRDPDPVIASVNAFLGGILDEKAMKGCIDPGLYRS